MYRSSESELDLASQKTTMLDRTENKFRDYCNHEPMLGTDGQQHQMDGVTRLPRQQCDALAALHRDLKPDLSIETGLAYGFSSLAILDAMATHGYGHHVAIDPGQESYWHGVALVAIDELGFSERFTWLGTRSDSAFMKMIEEKTRAQFVFLDGLHTFEAVLTDFCLVDQILDVGGLLIVNDMWLPSMRAVASFLETNMTNYEPVTECHENIYVARKARQDARSWDHFVPFNAAGRRKEKPRLFEKLFGT